ncbi:aminotransferase class I/II-fold pyridoxal phosphate-dependent enzyme [Stappia sp. F7233]|uniref:Aminotransferase class I/II-fold pyridoxal phosphate-dependent enzyme n=1 Tax=Stappia albiluteola TaxID=2758565 RepID=A0A839AIJ2_9HYPH|nr:aminotransferase class I/II-fold pyridoxal phosphate-dependent enzyme [Stappia albiluteola]MBA5778744.1 aminotransferase class I/II-fold pyridoxal phosphate-dependent enzyme [Stappia albiluteola]
MKPDRPSFSAVSERRFRLAGKAIIEQHNPYFVPVDAQKDLCERNAVPYVSFAHYDYLGLSRHPQIIAGASAALHMLGSSVGASRLVGGERSAHRAFENDLADFLGVGGAMTLVSGYLANVTLINHLMGPRDLVLIDELAHNSIFVGAKSGRYDYVTFAHNDLDDLEAKLGELRASYRHVLVVVEGLYSMDGDIPDLPRLVELKEAHDAWLLLDEAHSYGVLGATGRGICEHFDIDPKRVELTVGTLSKSFVSSGGFICAEGGVVDWLRFTLPGFVYSVGLAPATLGSAHAALTYLRNHPERVLELHEKSAYFLNRSRAAGLNTGDALGYGVVPLLFDTPQQTMLVSQALMEAGVYAPPIVQIGVPKDQPRIRFFISAEHSFEEIDRTISIVAETAAAAVDSHPTVAVAAAGH